MALQRLMTASLARRLFGTVPARTLALVRAAWPRAVGPDLARRTEVLALDDGTLRVRVPDARWRKELHRMQRDILGRLREIVGDLAPRRMGFLEGPVAAAPEHTPGAAPPPAPSGPPAPPAELLAGAAVLEDPEMRRHFLEVAARYLERSKGGSHA